MFLCVFLCFFFFLGGGGGVEFSGKIRDCQPGNGGC